MADLALGRRLMDRLDALARFSDAADGLTRLYLSPSHKRAADALAGWMREAGLDVRLDAVGTLIGRYEGAARGMPALLVGSHIDTVRQAGKYDGTLGVLAALTAVEVLSQAGERLPFAIEVVAFGDEEGVRFPSTLRGSRTLAGTLDAATLDECDATGTSVRKGLIAFDADPTRLAEAAYPRGAALGFVELHIEQGPVLERMSQPVGVVTAINGARRLGVVVQGTAGHAGTSPMNMRRDGLAAAAEMILSVERIAAETRDVVATVGVIEARPGAVNVIPGETRFTIDARAPEDAARDAVVERIGAAIEGIAARRGLAVRISQMHSAPATACDAKLIAALDVAARAAGHEPVHLPSGAGHDAMAMAALCPVAMLFVRCAGGISHHPAESISHEDADAAMRVLLHFLRTYRT
ncbi:MAG: Zn-dependent hydrolase [Alphaproteobacteria bacterium 64-6]|nr:allantoate amidohydrolase [Hyphomicrobium sp.]OJU23345.1 MAG: Zn-dependent hydrolase [Alphaproteobacteria bacterium 64-6]